MKMNWPRFFFALLFAIWQNDYFGWNRFPKSDAELLADGVSILLLSLSFVHSAPHNSTLGD